MKRILIALIMALLLTNATSAAISNLSLQVNQTYAGYATDRGIMNTNASLNFTFEDSIASRYTNITFPNTFNFSGVLGVDIKNNTGSAALTVSKNTTVINITYTGVAAQRFYFNITKNITLPPTAGTYAITVFTNGSTTPSTVYLYVRNSSRPYYVFANNSVFTVGTETYGDGSTTIPLTGYGASRLTLFAPNITGQTNISAGYTATNASRVWVYSNLSNGTLIFIDVKSDVYNPTVVLSAATGLQTSNLPAAMIGGGAVATLITIYILRRRRH